MSDIAKQYRTAKAECEKNISGVCEGCGGKLSAIETVDNSGHPTFWVGCEHCSCFRSGVQENYFLIARKLVEEGTILPYSSMCRREYEHTPERLSYFLDSQTAGLSHNIAYIAKLLGVEELERENQRLRELAVKDWHYRWLLDLFMCSDPFPMPEGHAEITEFMNEQARVRGFTDWIDAYHNLTVDAAIQRQKETP